MSRIFLKQAQSLFYCLELRNKVFSFTESIILLPGFEGELEFEAQLFVLVLLGTQIDADQLPRFCLCDAALD